MNCVKIPSGKVVDFVKVLPGKVVDSVKVPSGKIVVDYFKVPPW